MLQSIFQAAFQAIINLMQIVSLSLGVILPALDHDSDLGLSTGPYLQ